MLSWHCLHDGDHSNATSAKLHCSEGLTRAENGQLRFEQLSVTARERTLNKLIAPAAAWARIRLLCNLTCAAGLMYMQALA